ncbi:MAG: type II secretion system protein [Phycisphaerae bacterium]|nr:type II secretion system protein [Phycisphaerae bacterium]
MKKSRKAFTLVELPFDRLRTIHKCKGFAFTLVELLVVVAIIALLVSILLPSLGRAKDLTRETICLTRLGGQMRAIHMYSAEYNGSIPTGPEDPLSSTFPYPGMPDDPCRQYGTNRLWIGMLRTYDGSGALIKNGLPSAECFFCPGDNSSDPDEELAKLNNQGGEDAYGSYLYRQMDQAESVNIDSLGCNDDGMDVRAILMDLNSEMPGQPTRHNHGGRRVNIGFVDSHAAGFDNSEDTFTLRAEDVMNPFGRIDEILKYADSL